MHYVWLDYNPQTMRYIEDWLDTDAVRSTGLDDGFLPFYDYWSNEDGFVLGKNFWCKVIFEHDTPLAVIAFCHHEHKLIIMEIVVAPAKRNHGIGTSVLKELFENNGIIASSFIQCEAIIYPSNIASRKAFEHAGFEYVRTHEDGSSMLYAYHRCVHQ